jgi:iron complex transport system ATP-binding protein
MSRIIGTGTGGGAAAGQPGGDSAPATRTQTNGAAITFDDVRVRYQGSDTLAVDGVSFVVPHGVITAVTGPNGSGKSTLVRALLQRVPLAGGRILVGQESVTTLTRRDAARRVAVVPQREDPVFPLTVREYVALGRYPYASLWRGASAADEAAIAAAAGRAQVRDLMDRATDELSGGEWQRVRIARALAQGGDALVLDEPTTFLDVAHEMAVFELMARLAREGMAVLVITHHLNLVARFADSVVLLHAGQVAATGTPAAVMIGPTLERVYEWPLVVARDPAVGAPMLIPLRAPQSDPSL